MALLLTNKGSELLEHLNNFSGLFIKDVSEISFDVILKNTTQKVIKEENNYLNYGSNNIVIKIEAEDKTTKEIHINVIRDKQITDIIIDSPLLMEVGDVKTLKPTLIPDDAITKELIWESGDDSIVEVNDGKVEAKKLGSTTITIYSKSNKNVKKVIDVEVLNLKITSSIYDVRRQVLNLDDDTSINDMIIGAEINEALSTFLTKLDNKEALIKFYDREGKEIEDLLNTPVKTGQVIKLEYNKKVYDSVYMVVRGDNTSDGLIDVDDYNLLVKQVLGKEKYGSGTLIFRASDVVETDELDVDDTTKVTKFILGKDKTMNK